jgi:hypothetical protein
MRMAGLGSIAGCPLREPSGNPGLGAVEQRPEVALDHQD